MAVSVPEHGSLRAVDLEGTRAHTGEERLASGEREQAGMAVAPLDSEWPLGCP